MTVYLDMVVLLNFLVDGLLLMGTNRLTGYPAGWKRAAAGAAFGGAYAGICMLPDFCFLGNLLWRTVSLGVMAVIAFGWNSSAIRRGTVFVLLSMALGGIAMGMSGDNFATVLLAAAGVAFLCAMGIQSPWKVQRYLPVELLWQGKQISLTALVDTGNTLRDPLTGQSVLVVGGDVAQQLGISREILRDPISALLAGKVAGARLIPYRAVGQSGGMLLMVRFERVLLDGKCASPMVAFAPEEIGRHNGYQALVGGVL